MDFLKNQVQRIQQQLSSLTASQRMLTAALVAIMVMTLVYWGRYAGTAEMEPLLDQAFQPADILKIVPRLKSLSIPYDVQGDRILVAADKKWEALADVAYAKMLPRNSSTGFQEMVDKLKPWAAPTERDAMFNNVREGMCAQIIQRFPGVENAAVMINPEARRSISHNTEPTATVEISTVDGEDGGKQLVDAAAATVSGSTSGLKTANVQVIVNGIHMRTGSTDISAGGLAGAETQLELQQRHEAYAAKKIRELLQEIPGVFVSVAVTVDASEMEKSELSFDKDKSLSQIKRSTESKNESNGGDTAPVDPGAVANTGLSIEPPAGAGGPSNNESNTSDEFENHAGSVTTRTKKPPGTPTVLSASVRVPRSYYMKVWRSNNPGKTADDSAVDALIKAAVPNIKAAVMRGSAIESEERIAVEAYADILPQLAMAGTPTTATMSIPTTIGKFGKEIALGGLALVSLFMVSMMVRKSAPPPVITAPTPAGSPPQLVASEAVAGEAGDGNPLLSGMELDEDAIVTQQMLDQVTTMVSDNPDAAASLVKRWLNRA